MVDKGIDLRKRGGRPVSVRLTRLISVGLSVSFDGASPSFASFANTNRSMSLTASESNLLDGNV